MVCVLRLNIELRSKMLKQQILKIAFVAVGILLIPLVLQLTIGTGVDGQGFNWKPGDFAVMGALIFTTLLLVNLVAAKMGKYKAVGVLAVLLGFFWLWAELAVGVFTNWGS